MLIILIVLLVIALFGLAPAWPYSAGWGYGPSGIVTVVLVILLVLLIFHRI